MVKMLKSILQNYRARIAVDEKFYFSTYTDVAISGMDAHEHYSSIGWKEGRDPSAEFCTLYYKDKYFGNEKTDQSPLLHHYGLRKKERASRITASKSDYINIQRAVIEPFFDNKYYVETYKIQDNIDSILHYLTIGWQEGNNPTRYFDGKSYIMVNRFLEAMSVCPYYHFISTSIMNGCGLDTSYKARNQYSFSVYGLDNISENDWRQSILAEFDANYYLSTYEDVKAAGVNPLNHYMQHGYKEGRRPNEVFSPKFYKEMYLKGYPEYRHDPFYHYLTIGRQSGYMPNKSGATFWPATSSPSMSQWEELPSRSNLNGSSVVVLIPICEKCVDPIPTIFSAIKCNQCVDFSVLVINDCDQGAGFNDCIQELFNRGLICYEINQASVGISETISRGMSLCVGKDVILLSCGTVPSNDWIDRLAAQAYNGSNIATVTPLSNNGGIFSYPKINHDNRVALEIDIECLDQYAKQCNKGLNNIVPLGAAFCLYMTKSGIESFRQNHTDSPWDINDYCIGVAQLGYVHAQANDVFVYHSGNNPYERSLPGDGNKAIRRQMQVLPQVPSLIYAHTFADPARYARRRLDWYRMSKFYSNRAALFISHSAGGGIEKHLVELSSSLADRNIPVIILRSKTDCHTSVEIVDHRNNVEIFNFDSDISLSISEDLFKEFLGWLNPCFIHVHSLAGFDWQTILLLTQLIVESGSDYYYTLHDYAPVCHRNNLITSASVYCGMAEVEVCRSCLKYDHTAVRMPDPTYRRSVYASFLASATVVFAPSSDVKERINSSLRLDNIEIRSHAETNCIIPKISKSVKNQNLRVAIVGAIGPHKGSYVLHSLAVDVLARDLPISFHIIGYSNAPNFLSSVGIEETGPYNDDAEALDLLRKGSYDLVFLPSIWPETYCYTLSLAIASGITPAVFDLGAQAERLRSQNYGLILEYSLSRNPRELNNRLMSWRDTLCHDIGVSPDRAENSTYMVAYYNKT